MVFSTKQKRRTRRWLTVPSALFAHAVVSGGLILTSFLSVESVPPPPITISFVAAPPPPPPPPPPPARHKKTTEVKPKEIPKPTEIVQPKVVPEEKPVPITAPEEDSSEDDGVDGGVEGGVEGGVVGGVVGGGGGGVLGGMLGGVDGGMLDQPLYAGIGGVTNPELIPGAKKQATYPEIARKAKGSGQGILQAGVKKGGTGGEIQGRSSPGSKVGFDRAAVAG